MVPQKHLRSQEQLDNDANESEVVFGRVTHSWCAPIDMRTTSNSVRMLLVQFGRSRPTRNQEKAFVRVTQQFAYGHFVYRHFVYYCITACRAVIHPTSVSSNHYFHQFQLLLTLRFLFTNPASTYTVIMEHNSYQAL